MHKDVTFLTELRPFRNYRNLDSLNKVVDYIQNEMAEYGYTTELQTWMAEGNEYSNVLCSYQPEKQKRLIIGAHYDVFEDQPGADDNASAVTGLLETLRLVSETKPDLSYGIDFVAYCLEEPPFFGGTEMGSYVHASSVAANKENIMGMICYEMIGYFSDEPGSQEFPEDSLAEIYPNTGNFIMTVGIEKYKEFNTVVFDGMKAANTIAVERIDFQREIGYADMSDQRNYWEFDIPALMINDTSFMRNPNYHQITDTIDTLDFEKMAGVIESVVCCLNKISGISVLK